MCQRRWGEAVTGYFLVSGDVEASVGAGQIAGGSQPDDVVCACFTRVVPGACGVLQEPRDPEGVGRLLIEVRHEPCK